MMCLRVREVISVVLAIPTRTDGHLPSRCISPAHHHTVNMIIQRLLGRNFSTSVKRMSHEIGGRPGENLPFNIDNKVTLTMWFILFFGSGLSTPFLILRYNLTK